jgi:aconitase A
VAGHVEFEITVRLDTTREAAYYYHCGIMKYVLRDILHDPAYPVEP